MSYPKLTYSQLIQESSALLSDVIRFPMLHMIDHHERLFIGGVDAPSSNERLSSLAHFFAQDFSSWFVFGEELRSLYFTTKNEDVLRVYSLLQSKIRRLNRELARQELPSDVDGYSIVTFQPLDVLFTTLESGQDDERMRNRSLERGVVLGDELDYWVKYWINKFECTRNDDVKCVDMWFHMYDQCQWLERSCMDLITRDDSSQSFLLRKQNCLRLLCLFAVKPWDTDSHIYMHDREKMNAFVNCVDQLPTVFNRYGKRSKKKKFSQFCLKVFSFLYDSTENKEQMSVIFILKFILQWIISNPDSSLVNNLLKEYIEFIQQLKLHSLTSLKDGTPTSNYLITHIQLYQLIVNEIQTHIHHVQLSRTNDHSEALKNELVVTACQFLYLIVKRTHDQPDASYIVTLDALENYIRHYDCETLIQHGSPNILSFLSRKRKMATTNPTSHKMDE